MYWLQVYVDGRHVPGLGRYIVKLGGTRMLPLKVLGALGIESRMGGYDGLRITLLRHGKMVRLTMYDKRAWISWRRRELTAYPRWHAGMRYVPLDFLVEAFGLQMSEDPQTNALKITTK